MPHECNTTGLTYSSHSPMPCSRLDAYCWAYIGHIYLHPWCFLRHLHRFIYSLPSRHFMIIHKHDSCISILRCTYADTDLLRIPLTLSNASVQPVSKRKKTSASKSPRAYIKYELINKNPYDRISFKNRIKNTIGIRDLRRGIHSALHVTSASYELHESFRVK